MKFAKYSEAISMNVKAKTKDVEDVYDPDKDEKGSLGEVLSKFNIKQLDMTNIIYPLGLIGIWFVCYLSEIFVGFKLVRLPVVVGDLTHVGGILGDLLRNAVGISNSGANGFVLVFLNYVLTFVLMIISSGVSMFLHANFLHLLGNILLFCYLVFVSSYLGLNYKYICKKWVLGSFLSIFSVWFIFEILAFFLQNMMNKDSVFKLLSTANIPVVGASAGLMTILGYLFIVMFYRKNKVSFPKWLLVLNIFVTVFSLLALMNVSANVGTASYSVHVLGMWIHIVGLFIGMFFAFREKRYLG